MTSQVVLDYLTKNVVISKGVVTFRSLSRDLNIHVSTAKKELAIFHKASQDSNKPIHATYIVTGEIELVLLSSSQDESGMDVDYEDGSTYDGLVQQTKVVLVGEKDLEKTKSQFSRIFSVYVYSLSPARLRDSAFVCEPTERLRQLDANRGPEFAVALGKIVGADVQKETKVKTTAASTSTLKKPATAPEPTVIAKPVEPKPKEAKEPEKISKDKKKEPERKIEEVRPNAEKDKPKANAKSVSDWMKSQPKENKKAEANPARTKTRASEVKVKAEDRDVAMEEPKVPVKRGVKRKSTVGTAESDSEEKAFTAKSTPVPPSQPLSASGASVKVKKGVLLSDDEEENVSKSAKSKVKANAKVKAQAARSDTEVERSLKAMMDIDDDQVIRASKTRSAQDEDVDMAEPEPEPEPEAEEAEIKEPELTKSKPRKKKEKKEVPVGRNGLKKKRVVKSRTKFDEKGYMVTEDYSEYESVDEEEIEAEPVKPKRKSKAKAVIEEASETEGKIKAKRSIEGTGGGSKSTGTKSATGGKKAGGQRELASFFQAKSKK
ncbi:hypothetical protein NEOLEDRAFT_1136926 [Neolentinus lepideus HHB14362 ss-1]|uniref:DNA polymerase delta subunit 3 n=1 Tax=Neolentinus lepideus HHB14362 ss-1 TaxID=1314782 RepID=A0A165QYR0_9AGAM|nr:hypothetical protein NEOLEDRAFT_1136926 [Neolentinus lepideus HHB14362 ss-1]